MPDPVIDQFKELRRIKAAYVDEALKWYSSKSTWPRVVFRLSGVVTLVSSLALPFLAANPATAAVGVPVASMLVAVLTGLNSFFGWDKAWKQRITSKLTLEGAIAMWNTQMDAAKNNADPTMAYKYALSATQDLIKATQALTQGETAESFTQLKFPEVTAPKNHG